METHKAYTIFNPEKVNYQIESVAAYDNNIIFGTKQGVLLEYTVSPNRETNYMNLKARKLIQNFSRRPIIQIDVVPELQLLFSLSDGQVNINDLNKSNCPIIFAGIETKGANIFSLNIERTITLTGSTTVIVCLCVAVRRKLQIWYWKENRLLKMTDFDLKDIPKTLVWSNGKICVGFRTDFVLYEMSGDKRVIFTPPSTRTIDSCITPISSEIFAVTIDENVFPVDIKRTIRKPSVTEHIDKFSIVPNKNVLFKSFAYNGPIQSLVWDEPYGIALMNDTVEIRVLYVSALDNETFIQKFEINPEISKLKWIIKSRPGFIFAVSNLHFWCIKAVDIKEQRTELIHHSKFQLAIQLTNVSDESVEEKQAIIHDVQTKHAYHLFQNKSFKESMKEFIKLKTDLCDVIRIFPKLLPPDNNSKTQKINYSGFEEHDFETATLALIDYLTELRLLVGIDSTTLFPIIDTTLLKCYLELNDPRVASLLRRGFCHLEESERALNKHEKYGELVTLYQTKGYHKKALDILVKQSTNKYSILFGNDRIIQYLQNLGPDYKHLIFEFAGLVLERNPEDGITIFTEDIQEVESLPRLEVLNFLVANHKHLVLDYLEHIINVWKEIDSTFHDLLIHLYINSLKEMWKDKMFADDIPNPEKKKIKKQFNELKKKLSNFLHNKTFYYTPEKVLKELPVECLFEERAYILGKLNKHQKVLIVYIQIIGDSKKAIEYCGTAYSKYTKVYFQLIQLLLNPPKTEPYSNVPFHPSCLTPDIETVLEILEKFPTRVPPHLVLKILPDSVPIYRLQKFFKVSIQSELEKKRKTQVLKGLFFAEVIRCQQLLMFIEAESVLITDFTFCSVCKRRINNNAAFIRDIDENIIHLACHTAK